MTKLIIAEKPSVATDIAKVLGGMKKIGDHYEGGDWIVANALGHLLELVCPEKYEVKRGKWTFNHLPVLPPTFDLKPIAKSGEKLKSLARLIRRSDVDTIINACDAGREGELIFRYIMQATKAKKKIERLWLQSMTQASIREAFQHLRTDAQMSRLADAARSRSEADWLVGINGTRAMTAFNSLDGGFFLTTVGRVQTPTLAVVVRRENEIRAFKPKSYWEVEATFLLKDAQYVGKWFNPDFKKDPLKADARPERLFERDRAREILAAIQGKVGQIKETSKRTTTFSPQLYDLTSLQREANTRFGFSAKTTLAIAQALYEKHKMLTYPRTDSRVLPEDYVGTVIKTLELFDAQSEFGGFASKVIANRWVKPSKRIFDNSKVSDHFAIIPTLQKPRSGLSEAEAKVYELVVRRFIAVFYPAAEYDVTTRITTVEGEAFKTEGRVLVAPGWQEVYGKVQSGAGELCPLGAQKEAKVLQAAILDCETKPPVRYTEATLLSAMEGAGRLVEDDELREAMADKGLGTPATRAAIIENLIDQHYMRREGRDLVPSAKAKQLFTLIEGLGIGALSDPALTGEWEYKLAQIEKGKLLREDFMREIREMTTHIVDAAKQYEGDTVPVENPTHIVQRCPKCGGEVVENYRRFACTNTACDFSLPKHPGGRTFEVEEVEELIGKGSVGPLSGFISKMGRPFTALLRLSSEKKIEFDFGGEDRHSSEEEDISALPVIGRCPKCGGRLLVGATSYVCEHAFGTKTCDFRCGRVILQQPVSMEEFQKILTQGRTSLLTDFVSNRTHRKFKAYLTLNAKTGKIGFEFQDRSLESPQKKSIKGTKEVAPTGSVTKKIKQNIELENRTKENTLGKHAEFLMNIL